MVIPRELVPGRGKATAAASEDSPGEGGTEMEKYKALGWRPPKMEVV